MKKSELVKIIREIVMNEMSTLKENSDVPDSYDSFKSQLSAAATRAGAPKKLAADIGSTVTTSYVDKHLESAWENVVAEAEDDTDPEAYTDAVLFYVHDALLAIVRYYNMKWGENKTTYDGDSQSTDDYEGVDQRDNALTKKIIDAFLNQSGASASQSTRTAPETILKFFSTFRKVPGVVKLGMRGKKPTDKVSFPMGVTIYVKSGTAKQVIDTLDEYILSQGWESDSSAESGKDYTFGDVNAALDISAPSMISFSVYANH